VGGAPHSKIDPVWGRLSAGKNDLLYHWTPLEVSPEGVCVFSLCRPPQQKTRTIRLRCAAFRRTKARCRCQLNGAAGLFRFAIMMMTTSQVRMIGRMYFRFPITTRGDTIRVVLIVKKVTLNRRLTTRIRDQDTGVYRHPFICQDILPYLMTVRLTG
jgi:hypothetical protein